MLILAGETDERNTVNNYIDMAAIRIDRVRSRLKRSWARLRFNRSIHGLTIKNHDKIIADAEQALKNKSIHEADEAYAASHDSIVKQGYALKKQVEQRFKNMYAGKTMERIAIQVPDPGFSPAGYSLFTNLAESLDFIGVPTCVLGWHDVTQEVLGKFNPTVLLTSDHASYLERIDWGWISKYRESNQLKIGLTASLAEYGSSPLEQRLDWAKKHGINFFYSFRDEAYISKRKEYEPFFDAGYRIL